MSTIKDLKEVPLEKLEDLILYEMPNKETLQNEINSLEQK